MSEARTCCAVAYPALDPPLFSFNSPQGMCPDCNGLGTRLSMDANMIIPDPDLTIRDGAVVPWRGMFNRRGTLTRSWGGRQLEAMEREWGLDVDKPWKRLSKRHRDKVLHGAPGKSLIVHWNSEKIQGQIRLNWEGLLPTLMRRYRQTQSEHQKKYYAAFMSEKPCPTCQGHRLKPTVLNVRVGEKSIVDLTEMTIREAYDFLTGLKLTGNRKIIAAELIKEIRNRLGFLVNVGLDYLMLSRKGPSLSGGESQRIRLASQVGSELTGVLYILDEPSIGLHQRDNRRLLDTLLRMRDIGNTVVVVEHDEDTIRSADHVIDFGPGAGVAGGRIVYAGTPKGLEKCRRSLTGAYLSGRRKIAVPSTRRRPTGSIKVTGATENNLRDLDVEFPLGVLTAVTGVSGAGKSTLVNDILYPALSRKFHNSTRRIGSHGAVHGLDQLDKVINIDQRPIGRTPRSNPATYIKVFDDIRSFFARLPDSRVHGYKPGRFSFNVKGGRCEACQGDGVRKIEMHFLADVYVKCEDCDGRRFNDATLRVTYKGLSIADVLELTVKEASEVFAAHPKIAGPLSLLTDVGLDYLHLGQPSPTLSGGEAQRIKLARELSKRATGRTLYLLDEPTTGLHFDDTRKLLEVLGRLVDAGNSIVVIEHNLDVIKTADWVIDMGPEGGPDGGQVIACGTPERVAQIKASYTGRYLKAQLKHGRTAAG